jgi:sugar phosphate isomerase/epimerase
MRLAIVVNATPKATPLAADIPLEDAVALAGDAGFDGVELAIADPKDVDVANLKVCKSNIMRFYIVF